MHRLITIKFSHYNEKARWALDRLRVEYREDGYLPLFHMPPVAWATRAGSDASPDHMSSRFSTPVLVTEGGECICDSSRIVRWASSRYASEAEDLYPDAACEELEQRFSRLGEHTRRLAYYWFLPDSGMMRQLARANVGPVQSGLFAAALPFGRQLLRRVLKIDREHAERSKQIVLDEISFANQRLGSERYLVADRFTAADLALATMLSPALLVSVEEGYGAVLPSLDRVQPDAAAFARQVRDTPAGRHALRMFREERFRKPPESPVR